MKTFFKALGIFVALITIVLVFGSCISSCNGKSSIKQLRYNLNDERAARKKAENRIAELETELEKEKIRADKAEQAVAGTIEDVSYIKIKFPSDGNYYKEAYDEVTFYSDSTCTQPIENPRFMSAEVDSGVAGNGLQVYILLLDNGKVCYCSQNMGSPYLITEQCYQELKAEQAEEEARAATE